MQGLCQHRCTPFFWTLPTRIDQQIRNPSVAVLFARNGHRQCRKMRIALRVAAGVDDSQSVELRDRAGMATTVSARQQCWTMTLAEVALRRMGRAQRNPSLSGHKLMGIAALHPSYKSGALEERGARTRKFGGPIDCVLEAYFRLNPDIAPRPLRVPRAERFRYAAIVQQPSP